MPIETAQIEPGLYLNAWIGHVTLDDVLRSEREGTALLHASETRVILVNDLRRLTHVPLDLKALRRVAESNPQIIALLVVKAPPILRVMGEAQAKLVNWRIEFFDELEQALERGRVMLREND